MIVFFYNFKVMKPSLTVFYKEIISSPYSKGSNSLEFNPILQKFSVMICEIILSKMVSRMSLIFRRSHFINNFVVKNNFFETVKSRDLFILKIFPHTILNILPLQISWRIFFQKNPFHWSGAFFTIPKSLTCASFFAQKINWILFSDIQFHTCFK